MNYRIIPIMLGIAIATQILGSSLIPDNYFGEATANTSISISPKSYEELKTDALNVLEQKCNSCHRKQNPLMIFKARNMEKRAAKIYQMVFVQRRMPKGDEVKLTSEEYNQLEKWLKTQQIF